MDKTVKKNPNFKTRKISMRYKIAIPMGLLLLIICLLLGINGYQHVYSGCLNLGLEEADTAANVAKDRINNKISPNLNSDYINTKEYDTFLKELEDVKKLCGIKYLYIIYENNGKLYYGLDADSSDERALPADNFNEDYENLKEVFAGNDKLEKEIDSTEDGDLITVYKPITDKDGNITCILGSDYDASAIVTTLNQTRNGIFAIAIICYLVGMALLIIIVNNIIRSLQKVDYKIYDIVNNEGDLTQQLDITTGDELELIANHVNSLISYMRNIMLQISANSTNLQTSSKTVVTNLNVAADGISDVSAIMEEMSASLEETSASMEQVTGRINRISETIQQIATTASQKSSDSIEIMKEAQETYNKAKSEQLEAQKQSSAIITSIEEKISKSKAVEEINQLIDEIINITEQTQLLALNASIEAARAGDAGKGFAVVAQEINNLATNSESTANQISEVSHNVISAVNDLAVESQHMANFVEDVAIQGYNKLLDNSYSYKTDVSRLNEVMSSFAEQSELLEENIHNILDTIDAVNIAVEESAKGVSNVTETAVELSSSIDDIGREADSNQNISKLLGNEVSKFNL